MQPCISTLTPPFCAKTSSHTYKCLYTHKIKPQLYLLIHDAVEQNLLYDLQIMSMLWHIYFNYILNSRTMGLLHEM